MHLLSCLPFFVFDLVYGFPTDEEGLTEMIMGSGGWFWYLSVLKLLRLFNKSEVTEKFFRLPSLFGNELSSTWYTVENIMRVLSATVNMLTFVHLFACSMMVITLIKKKFYSDESRDLEDFLEMELDSTFYINHFYFMTTTITAVGYGDSSGDFEFYGFNKDENKVGLQITMFFLMVAMIVGNILFALINNEVFTLRFLMTVEEIVKESMKRNQEFFDELQHS